MGVVSALFVGTGILLMLRYAFGRQMSNALLFSIFSFVFLSLTVLNFLAEPFTLSFQAGIALVFIVVSIVIITMMPPQKIDREKEKDPLKVTEKDSSDMKKAGLVFFILTLLTGFFIFIAA